MVLFCLCVRPWKDEQWTKSRGMPFALQHKGDEWNINAKRDKKTSQLILYTSIMKYTALGAKAGCVPHTRFPTGSPPRKSRQQWAASTMALRVLWSLSFVAPSELHSAAFRRRTSTSLGENLSDLFFVFKSGLTGPVKVRPRRCLYHVE